MRVTPASLTLLLPDFGDESHIACSRCAQSALARDHGQPPDRPLAEGACAALAWTHHGLSRFWEASGLGLLAAADPRRYPPDMVALGGAARWRQVARNCAELLGRLAHLRARLAA
ncbi:MAG: hypothetical protein IT318_26660 [Anaerolineales bacterium]|nr:hypothetical protein [Anaerolineales bacterium]